MREILFRGKSVLTGKWNEGFLVKTGDHFRISTQDDLISFGVDPETVGQYTGMKDKNGKKIFEGDIVVYDNTPYSAYGCRLTCEIIFRKCQWQGKYAEFEGGYYYALSADDFFGAKSEVIGNVYDNPELLGGADNGAN